MRWVTFDQGNTSLKWCLWEATPGDHAEVNHRGHAREGALEMGYVDLVATLPEHRRKGVASALVAHLVTHSQALGNRWTALEVQTETPAERIYERLGFRTIYHRPRYIR